jgi:type II secretory pathway pseudopilin PulG
VELLVVNAVICILVVLIRPTVPLARQSRCAENVMLLVHVMLNDESV